MIIAYHAIFTTYGTWLPNDPRGSYSKKIYSDALAALGEIHYGREEPQPGQLTMRQFRVAVRRRLSRPPYYLKNETRGVVAEAFERVVGRLELNVPACAIMNDHVHLLVMRSKHTIEYIVNQLKGAATAALDLRDTPWTRGSWNVFINDEDVLRAAARYIEENPIAARLRPQRWKFITPLPPEQ